MGCIAAHCCVPCYRGCALVALGKRHTDQGTTYRKFSRAVVAIASVDFSGKTSMGNSPRRHTTLPWLFLLGSLGLVMLGKIAIISVVRLALYVLFLESAMGRPPQKIKKTLYVIITQVGFHRRSRAS